MIMQLEKLPSIGLEQTIAIDTRVQQAVLESVPEVAAIVARAGSDELGLDPMGTQPDRQFPRTQATRHLARRRPGMAGEQLRQVMADFPASASPSRSRSTCASQKC